MTAAASDDRLWEEISALLEGRPGWSVQASSSPGMPPSWCLLEGGEVDLAVSVDGGAINVYVMETDRDVRLETVAELAAWLELHQGEALRHPLRAGEVVDEILRGDITHWGAGGAGTDGAGTDGHRP